MGTLKEESIKAISKLPEETDMMKFCTRLYVINKIKKGKEAVLNGETFTLDELKKEVSKW